MKNTKLNKRDIFNQVDRVLKFHELARKVPKSMLGKLYTLIPYRIIIGASNPTTNPTNLEFHLIFINPIDLNLRWHDELLDQTVQVLHLHNYALVPIHRCLRLYPY